MQRWQFKVPAAIAHPARALPLVFAALTLLGTLLLKLPVMRAGDHSPTFMEAFFTATSAITVTGLTTVDINEYWSLPGHIVILILVEIGGLGFIAMATLLAMFVGGGMGLRSRLAAQVDLHVTNIGDVAPLFKRIALTTFAFQGITAIYLMFRYQGGYGESWAEAAWHGLFDAVMAFNNAGFSLNSDSLGRYAGDFLVIVPLTTVVFFGAIGFPVLAELYSHWRKPSTWSIHTRLTVFGSLGLAIVGTTAFLVMEWTNAGTLGGQPIGTRVLTAFEAGVMPRSGGLASFDWTQITGETQNLTSILMFIGGGSASTAGGIKVTTFLLLAFVILAELRGDPQVRIGVRSIGSATVRTALSIALIAVALVSMSTLLLMMMTDVDYSDALFEVCSAFGTVGLSMGVTEQAGTAGQLILIFLMFVGRVGTVTAASTFLLRRKQQRFYLPEERPIIG